MALDFSKMAEKAMTGVETPEQLLQQEQMKLRQHTQTRGILAAARTPFKNPYDGLTPEQPAPQSVYSQDPSTTMSQWKGVK